MKPKGKSSENSTTKIIDKISVFLTDSSGLKDLKDSIDFYFAKIEFADREIVSAYVCSLLKTSKASDDLYTSCYKIIESFRAMIVEEKLVPTVVVLSVIHILVITALIDSPREQIYEILRLQSKIEEYVRKNK